MPVPQGRLKTPLRCSAVPRGTAQLLIITQDYRPGLLQTSLRDYVQGSHADSLAPALFRADSTMAGAEALTILAGCGTTEVVP
jgi:hypothetical protein